MKSLPLFLWILILLATGKPLRAQRSLWEGSRQQLEGVRKSGQENRSKLKAWKKHIETWGLDSNYRHALALSGRLNTNGWSAGVYYVKQIRAGKMAIGQLHFSEIRHEKETRLQASKDAWSSLGKPKPYIFGKVNQCYTLQFGYGREQLLFPGLIDGNLSLSFRYLAGPAVAFLKPYYLQLVYVDFQPEEVIHLETEKFSPENADHFLAPQNILAPAKWTTGIGETALVPGIFAECALVLEPNRAQAFVKSIILGGNIALYSKPLEIMAETRAYPYQLSFFIGLGLGKRWK